MKFACSIYKRVKSLKDEHPHIVFDSNKIQCGSVIQHEYSPNGKYCAFTTSDKSQSSIEVRVIDVESGEMRGNRLQLFSFDRIAWSADSQGFFIYVIIYFSVLLSHIQEQVFFLYFEHGKFGFELCFRCSMIQTEEKNDIFTIIISTRRSLIS